MYFIFIGKSYLNLFQNDKFSAKSQMKATLEQL